jgi:hypothetical protein
VYKALAALVAILPPGAACAADCIKGGDMVTLAGTVKTQGMLDAKPYRVMTFDKPVCLKDAQGREQPEEKAGAVAFIGSDIKLKDGQHASLRGVLGAREGNAQAPERLVLTVTNKPADIPQKEERPISGKDDPVAGQCAERARKSADMLGDRILRVVVTQTPRWGTVWRADSAHPMPGAAPTLWRTVCWKDASFVRPLQMFDKTKNIPPL